MSTQRNPFASSAPLAYRPLSAIAATVAGGVPQRRILRILTELIPVLYALHEKEQISGNISIHSIGLDELGHAHLMESAFLQPASGTPPQRVDGFAPFECYLSSVDWPRGPWTDIYSLSAVIYALITGKILPTATARSINDPFQPLSTLALDNYTPEFLAAIDTALAVHPEQRPRTIKAFAETLGLSAFCVIPSGVEIDSGAQESPAALWINKRYARKRSRQKAIIAIGTGAIVVAIIAVWSSFFNTAQPVITGSEPVVKAVSPVHLNSVVMPSRSDEKETLGAQLDAAQAPDVSPAPETPVTTVTKPKSSEAKDKPAAALVKVGINVRPWGEIIIDGVSRGITPPLKTVMLRPGTYAVRIVNSARAPYDMTLVVTPNQPAVITHSFR